MTHYRLWLGIPALLLGLLSSQRAFADGLATYHSCGGRILPDDDEVFVYVDPNYKNSCAALYVGWYPYSGTGQFSFGLPNDSISSFRAGSNARVKLWVDGIYGRGWSTEYFGSWGADSCVTGNHPDLNNDACCDGPCGWADEASSIQVTSGSRDRYCGDLQLGEFAVFTNFDARVDCTVLTYPANYPDALHMGMQNDAIIFVDPGPQIPVSSGECLNGGQFGLFLYRDANYGGGSPLWIPQSGGVAYLPSNWVNVISSIKAVLVCNVG